MDNPQKELSASEKLLELIRAEKSPVIEPVKSSPESGGEMMPVETNRPGEGVVQQEPASTDKPPSKTFPRPRLHKPASFRWKPPFSLPSRTTFSIGIDFDQDLLKLVKIQMAGGRTRLLEHMLLPLPPQEGPEQTELGLLASPGFKTLLRQKLRQLCSNRRCALWTVLPGRHLEIVPVSIPGGLSETETGRAILWAAKKKAELTDDKIIDFTPIQGSPENKAKIQVLAYLADQRYIDRLKALFEEIGFPLTGVTVSSLAIQNLFTNHWLRAPAGGLSSLILEEEKAHIDLYFHHRLIFSREIKTGLHNLSNSEADSAGGDGNSSTNGAISSSATTDGGNVPVMEESPALKAALDQPAVSRLVRQMERTFDHCIANFGSPRPEHLFLSGSSSIPDDFQTHLESELGIPCSFIDPFAADQLFLGEAIPPARADLRRQLATAIGLALADRRRAQNFLLTRNDREEKKKSGKTDLLILACSLFLLIGIGFGNLWHNKTLNDRKAELTALKNQIAAIPLEPITGPALLKTAAAARELRQAAQENAERFHALAIVGDLMDNLPQEIKLSRLTVNGRPFGTETVPDTQTILEGLVVSPPQQKDFHLAQFLRKAGAISSAREAKITSTGARGLDEGDLLPFSIGITMKPLGKEWSTPETRDKAREQRK